MKKIVLLLVTAITVFLLFSCKGSSEEDVKKDKVLFSESVTPTFVYNDDSLDLEIFDDFYKSVNRIVSSAPSVKNDSSESKEREIVVGKSSRPLSKAAYEKLGKLRREDDRDIAYLIYSDGSSIAIAYEEDKYGVNATARSAFDYIVNTAISCGNSFVITEGVIKSEFVDPVAYQTVLDEEITEKNWENVKSALGGDENADEIVKAMREMYNVYSDEVIDWFANLYDPAVGGFYYSNSGRDTEGYLPDAESTVQALNFIDASGLSYDVGGRYEKVLPDWMKAQIISFVKGLQDPDNGYFYHPQWGKDYIDTMISRRGRDLNWCCGMLSRLGSAPTYNTPSGVKGDGILADGTKVSKTPLPMRLGRNVSGDVSRVLAVSAVIPAAEVAHYLKDKASLENYLESLGDFGKNSYGFGDELATIAPEFKARDKELIAAGKTPFAVETVIKYLDERQNPVTGLWTYGDEVTYEGTNGLLKISSAYNTLEAEIHYPVEAARSAIETILTDEVPGTICYAYNSWFCVSNIIQNLKYHSSAKDGREKADQVIEATRAIAVEGIKATTEKLAMFRMDDGSFSYLIGSTTHESHGMPVAIPGTVEGDVNATEIAIGGTSGHVFNALGLSGYKVPVYTKSDRMRYFDIIEQLGPVVKDEENREVKVYDFEDETAGNAPTDVNSKLGSNGDIIITKDYDGTNGNKGKYVIIDSKNNGGDSITVNCDSVRTNAGCYILEGDFYFGTPTASGNAIQITLGNKAYMLVMKVEGGNLILMDVSAGTNPRITNDLCKLPMQEWFHLRVEYYPNSEEKVRTKIYLDGELKAITDNYYDSKKTKLNGRVGKPSKSYINAEIYVMSYCEATLLVDNLSSFKTNDIYMIPTPEEAAKLNVNVDSMAAITPDHAPGSGLYYNDKNITENAERNHYDFMGYPMPSFSGSSYANIKAEGGSLVFTKTASGESYLQFKLAYDPALLGYSNYCSVFEFDYKVTDTDISYDNAPFRLDDSNYIRFVKNSDGVSYSLGEKDTANIVPNKWSNIRFETYYVDSYREFTKIYVDGEYAATVRSSTVSPFNSRICVYMKKGVGEGNVIKMDNIFYAHIDKEYVDASGNPMDKIEANVGTPPKSGEYFNSEITANAVRYDYSGAALPSVSGADGLVCNDSGTVLFIKTGGGETYLNYSLGKPSLAVSSPCSVFEFDFKFDSEDATGNGNYGISFRFDGNDIIYLKKNSDGESYSLNQANTANIKSGEWCNIRFEIYTTASGKIAKIFVNGVFTSEAKLTGTDNYNNRLLVYMKKDVKKNDIIYIDNMFIGHVDKSYQ